jgi:hypothetical protein
LGLGGIDGRAYEAGERHLVHRMSSGRLSGLADQARRRGLRD